MSVSNYNWNGVRAPLSEVLGAYNQYTGGSVPYIFNRLAKGFKRKRPTATVVESEKKRKKMPTGTYSQKRTTIKRGYKIARHKYLDKVTSQAVTHIKERASAVSDPADATGNNRGAVWLAHGINASPLNVYDIDTGVTTAEANWVEYPVHVFSLCNTRANPAVGNAIGGFGWVLGQNSDAAPAPRTAKMFFKRMGAWDRTVTPTVPPYPAFNSWEWEIVDNEADANTYEIGRKGLLEWLSMNFMFYGKKTRPTKIKLQMVKFLEDSLCPDFQHWEGADRSTNPTGGAGENACTLSDDGMEFWRATVKPLISSPIATYQVNGRGSKVKVLSTKFINLAPKETVDSDQDPHQEVLKWFQRVNQTIDYSVYAQGMNNAQLDNPQYVQPNFKGKSKVPNQDWSKNLYLVVTSYQPERAAVAPADYTNSSWASYDFNINKSTAVITV